jgi:hypothetical protein
MALRTAYSIALSGSQTVAKDMGTVSFPFSLALSGALTDGVASGMADLIFTDQRTLAASASEDLDVVGSLEDAVGATISMAKVKCVFIKAASANTNDVVLSRPAANGLPLFGAASDAISIKPGGAFMWLAPATGVTATAGTADLLTVAKSAAGTPVTYDVVIVGTSA